MPAGSSGGQTPMRKTVLLCLLFALLYPGWRTAPYASAEEHPLLRVEPGGHISEVRHVLFTADGDTLISVGKDKVVRIWNLKTRTQRTIYYPVGSTTKGQLFAAALNPVAGSHVLAVGEGNSQRCNILLFNYATGELIKILPGHDWTIAGLAFSPDGSLLASTGGDGRVRVWDPVSGSLKWEQRLTQREGALTRIAYIFGVAFSPPQQDNRVLVATGTDLGMLDIWDAKTGKRSGNSIPFGKAIRCLAWSKAGVLAIGTENGGLFLWDPSNDHAPRPLPMQPDAVDCLAFSQDGQKLVTGGGEHGADFKVRVWSVPQTQLLSTFEQHRATVFATAFSPDATLAASADGSGIINLWHTETGLTEWQIKGVGTPTFEVGWSANSQQIAWNTEPGALYNAGFDLESGVPLLNVPQDGGWNSQRGNAAQVNVTITPDRSAAMIHNNGR